MSFNLNLPISLSGQSPMVKLGIVERLGGKRVLGI